jgi:hypothetical protein
LKSKVYGELVYVLSQFMIEKDEPDYLIRTVRDLLAVCFKALFEEAQNTLTLERAIQLFIPDYILPSQFNTTTETDLHIIPVRYAFDYLEPTRYLKITGVFISMFDYLLFHASNKSYY